MFTFMQEPEMRTNYFRQDPFQRSAASDLAVIKPWTLAWTPLPASPLPFMHTHLVHFGPTIMRLDICKGQWVQSGYQVEHHRRT